MNSKAPPARVAFPGCASTPAVTSSRPAGSMRGMGMWRYPPLAPGPTRSTGSRRRSTDLKRPGGAALREMAAFDGPVRGAGTAESWRVETGYAAGQVTTDRAHPEQFTRVPRLQAAQDGQHPTDHAPGQDALVVPLQRLSVQRHHGERAAADLHGRVRGPDRQPAATERVRHRGRHHQAGRDEREE